MPKSEKLQLWVSLEQADAWREAAARQNTTLSEWVRRVLDEHCSSAPTLEQRVAALERKLEPA